MAPVNEQVSTAGVCPAWSPSERELDDLEVLLLGGYAPLPGYPHFGDVTEIAQHGTLADGTAWPVAISLEVPVTVGDLAAEIGTLDVLDEEGAPVARLTVEQTWSTAAGTGVAGPVQALAPLARGCHRALRRAAVEMDVSGLVLGVPVRRAMRTAEVEALRASASGLGARILILPLVGQGSPVGVDGVGLVGACLATADLLARDGCTVEVVAVPVPRHAGATDDAERLLAALVAKAYGATHTPGPLPPFDGLPAVVDLPLEPDDERRSNAGGCTRQGLTVLFTGLSGSGKSTLASAVHDELLERFDRTVTLLDGDVVRRMLSAELTFSREHRELNVRRIGFVAAEVTRHGGIALCAPIAPHAHVRAEIRALVEQHGRFVLVHVSTPLVECERRDRKGLYAKARRGEIPAFTGISDPYDVPADAELTVDTSIVPLEAAVRLVMTAITTASVHRGH